MIQAGQSDLVVQWLWNIEIIHQIVFSGKEPEARGTVWVVWLLCRLADHFILQTSIYSLPWWRWDLIFCGTAWQSSTERSSSVAVVRFHSNEPKQQHPRNINTYHFQLSKNTSNSFCVCLCVFVSTWIGKSTLHWTKRRKQHFSTAHQGALWQWPPGVTAASDVCKWEETSGSGSFLPWGHMKWNSRSLDCQTEKSFFFLSIFFSVHHPLWWFFSPVDKIMWGSFLFKTDVECSRRVAEGSERNVLWFCSSKQLAEALPPDGWLHVELKRHIWCSRREKS